MGGGETAIGGKHRIYPRLVVFGRLSKSPPAHARGYRQSKTHMTLGSAVGWRRGGTCFEFQQRWESVRDAGVIRGRTGGKTECAHYQVVDRVWARPRRARRVRAARVAERVRSASRLSGPVVIRRAVSMRSSAFWRQNGSGNRSEGSRAATAAGGGEHGRISADFADE